MHICIGTSFHFTFWIPLSFSILNSPICSSHGENIAEGRKEGGIQRHEEGRGQVAGGQETREGSDQEESSSLQQHEKDPRLVLRDGKAGVAGTIHPLPRPQRIDSPRKVALNVLRSTHRAILRHSSKGAGRIEVHRATSSRPFRLDQLHQETEAENRLPPQRPHPEHRFNAHAEQWRFESGVVTSVPHVRLELFDIIKENMAVEDPVKMHNRYAANPSLYQSILAVGLVAGFASGSKPHQLAAVWLLYSSVRNGGADTAIFRALASWSRKSNADYMKKAVKATRYVTTIAQSAELTLKDTNNARGCFDALVSAIYQLYVKSGCPRNWVDIAQAFTITADELKEPFQAVLVSSFCNTPPFKPLQDVAAGASPWNRDSLSEEQFPDSELTAKAEKDDGAQLNDAIKSVFSGIKMAKEEGWPEYLARTLKVKLVNPPPKRRRARNNTSPFCEDEEGDEDEDELEDEEEDEEQRAERSISTTPMMESSSLPEINPGVPLLHATPRVHSSCVNMHEKELEDEKKKDEAKVKEEDDEETRIPEKNSRNRAILYQRKVARAIAAKKSEEKKKAEEEKRKAEEEKRKTEEEARKIEEEKRKAAEQLKADDEKRKAEAKKAVVKEEKVVKEEPAATHNQSHSTPRTTSATNAVSERSAKRKISVFRMPNFPYDGLAKKAKTEKEPHTKTAVVAADIITLDDDEASPKIQLKLRFDDKQLDIQTDAKIVRLKIFRDKVGKDKKDGDEYYYMAEGDAKNVERWVEIVHDDDVVPAYSGVITVWCRRA